MPRRDPYQALLNAGIPPSAAQVAIRTLAATLHNREDDGRPFTAGDMQLFANVTEQDIEDARVDWYVSDAVPAWAKRLLDAR